MFAAYFSRCRFRDLHELTTEAKHIQGDVFAARAYRLPPHMALSLELCFAWNSGVIASHSSRVDVSASFADEQVQRGGELSDHALDPYTFTLKTAQTNAACSAPRQEHEVDARQEERHTPTTERRSYDPPEWSDGRPGHQGLGSVATKAVDQGTSTVTVAAQQAKGELVVRETADATVDPRWIPCGDLENNWCYRVTCPFSLSHRRCCGLAGTVHRANNSPKEVCCIVGYWDKRFSIWQRGVA